MREQRSRRETSTAPIRVLVHVQPRASRGEIVGLHGAAIKVRLTAPPVDNAANEELVALLRGVLGLPRGAVRIVAGARGRSKVVELVGATPRQLEQLATSGQGR